jgi:chemotaxis protein methyltransferase CheR
MTLTQESFTFVADLVRRRSAIQLDAGKEYLVESRLLPLARRAAAAMPQPAAMEAVVEALTTNETSWFRDAQPFQALVDHVVPEMLGPARPAAATTLRVWSAACSSGQEPYSITMALAEALPQLAVNVLATDLSDAMLTKARTGRYGQLEVNRGLPAPMLVKYFARAGADWEVVPAVRNRVTFLRHNLLDAPPTGGPFDVVFLRNVLIYFDLATKRDVLRRVQQVLRPGGFLLLGAAETTIGIDDTWERVPVGRGSVYRSTVRRAA